MQKLRCRPCDPASRFFWENICSRLPTMARSSIPAAATTPGRRWSLRASMSGIVQRCGLSSRRMRSRLALANRMPHPNFSLLPESAGETRQASGDCHWRLALMSLARPMRNVRERRSIRAALALVRMEQPHDHRPSNFHPGHGTCCHSPGVCRAPVTIIERAIACIAAARFVVTATGGADGHELRRIQDPWMG